MILEHLYILSCAWEGNCSLGVKPDDQNLSGFDWGRGCILNACDPVIIMTLIIIIMEDN